MSSAFVNFYVFHKGKPIASGEIHKVKSLRSGFFLVLSGLFWYDKHVEF